MPIYEFACVSCKTKKEHIMKMSEYEVSKDILACESCGGKLRPLVGKLNFRLAGHGWADMGYNITSNEMAANTDDVRQLDDI